MFERDPDFKPEEDEDFSSSPDVSITVSDALVRGVLSEWP